MCECVGVFVFIFFRHVTTEKGSASWYKKIFLSIELFFEVEGITVFRLDIICSNTGLCFVTTAFSCNSFRLLKLLLLDLFHLYPLLGTSTASYYVH